MPSPYLIRAAQSADLPTLSAWRATPEVVQWWGDPAIEPETEKFEANEVAMWIAEFNGEPFAFIQDYAVADWAPHHFDYLPLGARGMDLYIGRADLLGHGHGTALVRQHVAALFAAGAPAVGIDPHPENLRAHRAFLKAGFAFAKGPLTTRWGPAILMDRYAG